jgi:hypothetical protein
MSKAKRLRKERMRRRRIDPHAFVMPLDVGPYDICVVSGRHRMRLTSASWFAEAVRAKLRDGPVPVREFFEWAEQVAGGSPDAFDMEVSRLAAVPHHLPADIPVPLPHKPEVRRGPRYDATTRRATIILSRVLFFVPRRIASEDLGDALEIISAARARGEHPVWIWITVITTIAFVIANAIRYWVRALRGKKRSR